MVLEAESFFARFYESSEGVNFALWAAALNEAFLVILSAIWLPAIDKGNRKVFHPGNLLIKLLVAFLFFNTVGGASLNVIGQKLAKIQEQENRIAVLKIRQSQIEDQTKNLATFIEQNQRLNTVLATREIDAIKEELVSLESRKQSTLVIWLEILLVFLVRFAIQLANVTSVWIAGWLYRQPLDSSGIFHPSNRPVPLQESFRREFPLSRRKEAPPETEETGPQTANPADALSEKGNHRQTGENNRTESKDSPNPADQGSVAPVEPNAKPADEDEARPSSSEGEGTFDSEAADAIRQEVVRYVRPLLHDSERKRRFVEIVGLDGGELRRLLENPVSAADLATLERILELIREIEQRES